ncbi:MAG TPA: hypothetical protein VN224_13915 [Xanthomonadales bacterium]|nr:hypothetical protein [Xanthomonadales bacterium]
MARYITLAVYTVVFTTGLFLTCVFAYTDYRFSGSLLGVVALVGFILLICILYFAEGAEIAVTTILDRDEDQIPVEHHERIRRLRSRHGDFLTGRQLIVVLMVLLLGSICDWLATRTVDLVYQDSLIPGTSQIPDWIRNIVSFPPINLYAYLFPAFSVLLFAQLYSKFVIHRRPQRFFASYWTQAVIWRSVPIGKIVRFGLPEWLIDAVVKKQVEAEVGASRLQLYRAQATFRDGIGFEKGKVDIIIDPTDGSTRVEEYFELKAFADGNRELKRNETWDGAILDEPKLVVSDYPEHCGIQTQSAPLWSNGRKNVKFDFGFALPLHAGDTYNFRVTYDVGPNASKNAAGDFDEFIYTVNKYPAKRVEFSVTLKDTENARIVLSSPSIDVRNVSDDDAMNAREAKRHADGVAMPAHNKLTFVVNYPLLPAEYIFKWRILNGRA